MPRFSEFVKNNQTPNNTKSNKKMDENDIQNVLEKYSSFSKEQLMDEFLKASKQKKQEGGLSDEECSKLTSVLSPYLSESQKQQMAELLERGKNV